MDAARFQDPRRRMIPIVNRWGAGEMAVLDFGDPQRPPDVLFLHANGFNAMTYRSLLAPLAATLRIIAPDLRGHGATTLPADPAGRASWRDNADDAVALLDALGGPPLTLAGHSMGGTCAVMAAAERPERVSNLLLLEPVIWPQAVAWISRLPGVSSLVMRRAQLAQRALRRRAVFADRREAMERYRGRGAFADWSDVMLADYLAAGLVEREGGQVELACKPEWEASNYAAQANDTRGALSRVGRPVRILRGTAETSCHLGADAIVHRRWPHVTQAAVPDGTHFFPMRQPDIARDAILDAAV